MDSKINDIKIELEEIKRILKELEYCSAHGYVFENTSYALQAFKASVRVSEDLLKELDKTPLKQTPKLRIIK